MSATTCALLGVLGPRFAVYVLSKVLQQDVLIVVYQPTQPHAVKLAQWLPNWPREGGISGIPMKPLPALPPFTVTMTMILLTGEIHFAPPKKRWNDLIPLKKTNKQWVSNVVLRWRAMDFVHRN